MSKKQHRKQVARAREKRQQDKFQRRTTRNRWIILLMAGLMVLSLIAIPLTQWLAGRGDAAAPHPEDIDPQEQAQPELAATADRADSYDEPFDMTVDPDATYTATLSTDLGEIVVQLDPDGAPVATNNFVNLARDGYYDDVIFHRVIEDFMIQGGDPTGLGTGNPGYRFDDELGPAEDLVAEEGGYPRGTLAMANSGADTNGSQFFIVHQDYPLTADYTVFGEVIDGLAVVDEIATVPTQNDRPVDPVAIRSIAIDED